ncbi:MAG: hypothetical protein RL438_1219 [Actinomycetota bacterium]
MRPVLKTTQFCSRILAGGSFTIDNVHKIFSMPFSHVYPHYVNKVERKGRSVEELNEVIRWLTGFSEKQLQQFVKSEDDFTRFFARAHIHENASLITGSICGVKIQEIEDPLMLKIRYMDKLVDELAKGRPMEKILRTSK